MSIYVQLLDADTLKAMGVERSTNEPKLDFLERSFGGDGVQAEENESEQI